jgi:predicted nucleic acid-binding protein
VRVFLDRNVLVSAFAARGICADLFEVILREHELVIGQNVLRELSKALRDKIRLPATRSSEIAEFVTGEAVMVIKGHCRSTPRSTQTTLSCWARRAADKRRCSSPEARRC